VFESLKNSIRGVVEKISKSGLSEEDLEPILWELQIQLISNDVSLDVAEKICAELKEQLMGEPASRFGDKTTTVRDALRTSIHSVLKTMEHVNLLDMVKESKRKSQPFVAIFIGINGTGKTTTIAKIAHLLQREGLSVVLASADTYRAGAIEQLEEHGKRLNVRVIKHRYGSDAAAVGYDAVQHAKARKIDVVLIDTAGRMQTNRNLMDELQKMKRVIQPDLTVMILDSLIGNDATEQALTFNEHVAFDAAILTKVDADARGGSSLSVAYLTGKPVIYVGIGQEYNDLEPFDSEWFTDQLLSEE
jgi:fused signal recognition particle receptor